MEETMFEIAKGILKHKNINKRMMELQEEKEKVKSIDEEMNLFLESIVLSELQKNNNLSTLAAITELKEKMLYKNV